MDWFTLVLKSLPAILAIVAQVEGLVTGQGSGPKKKAIVVDTVKSVAPAAGVATEDIPKIGEAVGTVVDGMVETLNSNGVFKK